jgi:hypothetical protein
MKLELSQARITRLDSGRAPQYAESVKLINGKVEQMRKITGGTINRLCRISGCYVFRIEQILRKTAELI